MRSLAMAGQAQQNETGSRYYVFGWTAAIAFWNCE